jgi:glycosyltransferase involved in cell wall biosynthesis
VKILFLNFTNGVHAYASGDPRAVGGAERQQWYVARSLAAAGWEVIVGLLGRSNSANVEVIDNVRFVRLPAYQGMLAPVKRFAALYRLLRSEAPDWFYWRCASYLFGPAAAIAKLANVKIVFAAAFDTDVQPRRALTERRALWPLYAWGLSRCERIFVQHSGQLRELPEKLRSKAAIVRNIIDLPRDVKRHVDREPYVAWVGMLRQPKRPDLLIEIARRAQHLRFKVCGGITDHRTPEGYGTSVVEHLARLPNVDYLGQVTPSAASEVIANAAALLCTSDGEGFPNTFLEAWANGTSVVSLTVDPDQILTRFQLGCLSLDIEKAVGDLTRLVGSNQQREEILDRARDYVNQHHRIGLVSMVFETELGANRQQDKCARGGIETTDATQLEPNGRTQ